MRSQLLPLPTVLLLSSFLSLIDASCHYPNGTFPTDYVYTPCSGTEFTSCCIASEGDQCLSNGLCYYPGGKYMFRGACSDQDWNSPNCFQHCKSKTGSYARSYERIVQCGNDRYCCYSDGTTCCNDDSKVFTMSQATVIKDLATPRSTNFVPIATQTLIRISATPIIGTRATTGISRTTDPTDTAATPASTSAPQSAADGTPAPTRSFSRTAIVASSVAATLIFVLIVGLLWFCIRRHYKKKLAESTKEQGFALSSDGFQKLPDKSPRPVEVPTSVHTPLPPYQPPAYASPPPLPHGVVEIDTSGMPPTRNQWGQPIYEAPAQPYR